jgi:hypothetical protein
MAREQSVTARSVVAGNKCFAESSYVPASCLTLDDATSIRTVTIRGVAHRKLHLVNARCRSVAIVRPPLQLAGRAQHQKG